MEIILFNHRRKSLDLQSLLAVFAIRGDVPFEDWVGSSFFPPPSVSGFSIAEPDSYLQVEQFEDQAPDLHKPGHLCLNPKKTDKLNIRTEVSKSRRGRPVVTLLSPILRSSGA